MISINIFDLVILMYALYVIDESGALISNW